MKTDALKNHPHDEFDFCPFDARNPQPACILINDFQSKTPIFDRASVFQINSPFKKTVQRKAKRAVIVLFVSGIIEKIMPFFRTWSDVVDISDWSGVANAFMLSGGICLIAAGVWLISSGAAA